MNHCLLMMGGVGSRFGNDIPKQYVAIEGKPIFIYILDALIKAPCINSIVVVSNSMWVSFVKDSIDVFIKTDKKISIVEGGKTRSESVKNGLEALADFASDDDVILIHDATHPYVDINGYEEAVKAVKKYGGATLGACQYDTCYQMDDNNIIEKVVPRQYLVSGASPEAFLFRQIYNIYKNAKKEEMDSMTSAGSIALAHNIKMVVIPSNVLNLKITYRDDMELFKKLIKNYFFKEEE